MLLENLQKYITDMANRTKLNVEGRKVSVFNDSWYFENMMIVAKRYYWGLFLVGMLYILVLNFLKDKDLFSMYMLLPVTGTALYVIAVSNALKQIKTDTKYVKKDALCRTDPDVCGAFTSVCAKISMEWIIFSIINWLASALVFYAYTFRPEVFYKWFAFYCAPAVLVNPGYLRILFRHRVAVIQPKFKMEINTMALTLHLKNGTEKNYTGDFDLSLNGCGLVVVCDSKDVFCVYKSDEVERLVMKNPPHEACYCYGSNGWEEA